MNVPIGTIVHYVSYGTPGGEYSSRCRAAMVTEDKELGAISATVFNPTGEFRHNALLFDAGKRPGTWHWPSPTCG